MRVVKRNGSEVEFDIKKIMHAIGCANREVEERYQLNALGLTNVSIAVSDTCHKYSRPVNVEEVQELVEDELMKAGAYQVAKRYIRYRYEHNMKRNQNTLDDKIMSLVEYENDDVKEENSNKNPEIIPTQRDYIAGEVSKDISLRKILPQDVAKAHIDGIIHVHDLDYQIQHSHNCDLVNLDDMLQNGTVISGTMIEKPHAFSTACNIATQIIAQVASSQYGLTN